MLLFATLPKPPSQMCCVLHHNRNLKHVVLAPLWQHKFAARHVVSVVQSGAPKTWHSCQLSWKPIELFRTLKTATHSSRKVCQEAGLRYLYTKKWLTRFAVISATCSFTRAHADRHRGVRVWRQWHGITAAGPFKYAAWQGYIQTFGTTVHPSNRFLQVLGNTSPRKHGEFSDSCVF